MLVQMENIEPKELYILARAQLSSTARIRIRIIAHEKHLWPLPLWIRLQSANETRTTQQTNEQT